MSHYRLLIQSIVSKRIPFEKRKRPSTTTMPLNGTQSCKRCEEVRGLLLFGKVLNLANTDSTTRSSSLPIRPRAVTVRMHSRASDYRDDRCSFSKCYRTKDVRSTFVEYASHMIDPAWQGRKGPRDRPEGTVRAAASGVQSLGHPDPVSLTLASLRKH